MEMAAVFRLLNRPPYLFAFLLVMLLASTLLATLFEESSWFSLLLLSTIFCGLFIRPRLLLPISIFLIGYTAVYNLFVLGFSFSAELVFVSLVWIIAPAITGAMRSLQHKLKVQESYYRHALALSPGALITLNPDHTVREWNKSAETLFGYTEKEAKGRNIDTLICGDDPELLARARSISAGVTEQQTAVGIRDLRIAKDGTARHLLISGAPIQIDGEFHGVVAAYTDVSELVAREENIQSLVQDKELLLKEVHHRVKNHMQSLVAMLNLYLSTHEDTRIQAELQEIQHKIQVMQSIYQHLYVDDRIDSIMIADLLGTIIDEFVESLLSPGGPEISLSAEEILLPTDQALHAGIIVNELLTNAVKYARPGEKIIRIEVYVRRTNDGALQIIVTDNGREEIPITPEEYGFGLQLVEGYTAQYEGEFRIEHNSAANSFIIELPMQEAEG